MCGLCQGGREIQTVRTTAALASQNESGGQTRLAIRAKQLRVLVPATSQQTDTARRVTGGYDFLPVDPPSRPRPSCQFFGRKNEFIKWALEPNHLGREPTTVSMSTIG